MKLKKDEVKEALLESLDEVFDKKKEIRRDEIHNVLSCVCEKVLNEAICLMTTDEEVFYKQQQVLYVFNDLTESVNYLKERGFEEKNEDIRRITIELHDKGHSYEEVVEEIVKLRGLTLDTKDIKDVVSEILVKEGLK